MSERVAVGLVYVGLFVLGLPLMVGLHALGVPGHLVSFAVILLFCAGAWTLSAVTMHYAASRRGKRDH